MRVLIGVDGSEAGEQALRYGLDLARRLGADTTVLHVLEEPPISSYTALVTGLSVDAARERVRALGLETIARAEERAREAGVTVEVKLLDGLPADVLLGEGAKSDLIVVGTHGYRGMDRVLLGSVAETLVRRSSVPVLVVR
ncbi:universal stress protein [Deinococcus planocerae]|uniref:universal stress protein n=1 Tax=Deinococcus planocerae TaxID=1737569 RepID=UPI000C7E8D6C|nr:universal stress protein [Deinococcus planocerae]